MRKSARTQIPPFFDNDPYNEHLNIKIVTALSTYVSLNKPNKFHMNNVTHHDQK